MPERALMEYLMESRRGEPRTGHAPDAGRAQPDLPVIPPKLAEQLDAIRSMSRISALLDSQMLMTAFQPIYGLGGKTVVGAEALSRFVSDDGAPAELWFAEAASVGLGANLEFAALGSAAAAARDLPEHLYVALNISPTSCIDPRLPELFEHIDLPVNRVVLELTEDIPDAEYLQFLAAVNPFRERGLRLAVDDTQPSAGALSRMIHLQPDFLKVGRNVISGIDTDEIQRALGACLVDFASQIGTAVVAEGIETAGELKALTELGVDAGQGYLLGRPSVRPQDWVSWNSRLDPDGLKRQLAEADGAGGRPSNGTT